MSETTPSGQDRSGAAPFTPPDAPTAPPPLDQPDLEPPFGQSPPPPHGQPAAGLAAPGAGRHMVITPRTSPKAVWSLICGIVSLVFCGLPLGITAIVLGNKAKDDIRRSRGMLTGEGLATAGVILGVIGLVLAILIIMVMAGQ